jgi:hypothetical protein
VDKSHTEAVDPVEQIKAAIEDGVRAFIIRGAAGTGKTTLVRRLLPLLDGLRFSVELIAPTGRAAKMLQMRTGRPASTIHSRIYQIGDSPLAENGENGELRWVFPLKRDRPAKTAFIVDESSMVGEAKHVDGILQFGSGSLLNDILDFSGVEYPNGDNVVMFVGDSYQLPPVGEKPTDPPALDERVLGGLIGKSVCVVELTEIFRQSAESGILQEANRLRASIAYHNFGCFSLSEHNDVIHVPEDGFDGMYHSERDLNDKIVIAYTNSQVWEYNKRIRALMGKSTLLPEPGERLLSLRNTRVNGPDGAETAFMNGDMLQVLTVDAERQITLEGFYRPKGEDQKTLAFAFAFCRMTVSWLYETEREDVETWVNVTPLISEDYRNNPEYASLALYVAIVNNIREKFGLRDNKADNEKLREQLKKSAFYHAPLVTFGYAITGHKSQGGEWNEAWIDYRRPGGLMNEDCFRWLYTVTTRARTCLYAITPPAIEDIVEAIERRLGVLPATETSLPIICSSVSLEQILARHNCKLMSLVRKPYVVTVKICCGDDALAELGSLEISHNGSGVVSYVRFKFPGASDELGADIAALKGRNIRTVIPEEKDAGADATTVETAESHTRIVERLVAAAGKAGLTVLSVKSLTENQLRLTLSSALGDGFVDFYVDGKGRVSEMGSMTISADSLRALRGGLA